MNSNSWRTYFLFVTVGLVSHGLLLINDGSYADGWFLEYYIGLGRWDVVKDWWFRLKSIISRYSSGFDIFIIACSNPGKCPNILKI